MGLDMYLSARLRLGKYCSKKVEGKDKEIRGVFPEMFKSGNLDTIEIKFEVGYWRKANQIHKWFVDNCQEGVDECQEAYVSRNKLKELKRLCEEVLKNKDKAEEVLPTQTGFFFGGDEYEEYYYNDLEDTVEIINKCLKLPDDWDFEYCSSW